MGLRLVLVLSALWSVAAKLLIQKAAPNFALDAAMPDDSTKTVSLTDFKNKQLGLIAGNVESRCLGNLLLFFVVRNPMESVMVIFQLFLVRVATAGPESPRPNLEHLVV